jgi:hypothetical protein
MTIENHKDNCPNPFDVRRFSLRGTTDEGKPGSIPYGKICIGCGILTSISRKPGEFRN